MSKNQMLREGGRIDSLSQDNGKEQGAKGLLVRNEAGSESSFFLSNNEKINLGSWNLLFLVHIKSYEFGVHAIVSTGWVVSIRKRDQFQKLLIPENIFKMKTQFIGQYV